MTEASAEQIFSHEAVDRLGKADGIHLRHVVVGETELPQADETIPANEFHETVELVSLELGLGELGNGEIGGGAGKNSGRDGG